MISYLTRENIAIFQQLLYEDIAKIEAERDTFHNREIPKFVKMLSHLSNRYDVEIDLFKLFEHYPKLDVVQLFAKSAALRKLFFYIVNPLLEYFGRENIKALIHISCGAGEYELVKLLVEGIHLIPSQEKVASPFNRIIPPNVDVPMPSFAGGDYPLVSAAASNCVPLIKYLLSFYNLKNPEIKYGSSVFQEALIRAIEKNAECVVDELLAIGVNPGGISTSFQNCTVMTPLKMAVTHARVEMVKKLIECGATVVLSDPRHSNAEYQASLASLACQAGNIAIVKILRDKGIVFDNKDEYLIQATKSGSVDFVRYCLKDLGMALYPSYLHKQHRQLGMLRIALEAGNLPMLHFMVSDLSFSLADGAQFTDRSLLVSTISSFNVRFIRTLFQTIGLMPDTETIQALMPMAYDSGIHISLIRKFSTHAYLASLCHKDESMRHLLSKVSLCESFKQIEDLDLFVLFADHIQRYPQRPSLMSDGMYFRDQLYVLAQEILRRDMSLGYLKLLLMQSSLDEARSVKNAIQLFLSVYPHPYSVRDVEDLLREASFCPEHTYHQQTSLLEFAVIYRRDEYISLLLRLGANPDVVNHSDETPITLAGHDHPLLVVMMRAAKGLNNSITCAMRDNRSSLLPLLLDFNMGDISSMDIKSILLSAKSNLSNVYVLLTKANETCFKVCEDVIAVEEDIELNLVLRAALDFKATGIKPAIMVKLATPSYTSGYTSGCFPRLREAKYASRLSDFVEQNIEKKAAKISLQSSNNPKL